MKKFKTIVCIFAVIIAILLPVAAPFCIALAIPSQYSNTFVGIMDEKVSYLDSIEGEKCVVIGGSSVAFGLDSELLAEHLGMPVVNFGLYAAIGTRAMIELSRESIGEGDIVILAPEVDPQTFSTYFSSDTTLKAIDGDYSLLFRFSTDSILSMLGGFFKHSADKLAASRSPLSDPDGIYNSASFNEYGDIKSGIRENNVMPLYYDPNTVIDLSADIVDDDFITMINDYVDYCTARGATVYFTYSPMNELALKDGTNTESIEGFEDYLSDVLKCDIISTASTYIMEPGYFYDTNFHLNDAGVTYRTRRLIEDIMFTKLPDGPEAPELPGIDAIYTGPEDENAVYFLYETMSNGALKIVGLTEAGKAQSTLTIPRGANGVKVTALGAGSFAGGVATQIIVTEDTYLRSMFKNSFADSRVTDLWIYYTFDREEDVLRPAPSFGNITVHVPPESSYTNHYDWLEMSGGFVFAEDAVR